MQKRIARWKRVSLIVILYELGIALTALAAELILAASGSNSYRFEYAADLFFLLNPVMLIAMFGSLFLEFIDGTKLNNLFSLLFCVLLPVGEGLLLLLGWRLAALGKRGGSTIMVACGTVHLLLDLLCILFTPLIGIFSMLYLVFPILLLYSYTRWMPPLKK